MPQRRHSAHNIITVDSEFKIRMIKLRVDG